MSVTVTVPDIGGAEGAEVVEILVAVGDEVELEQSLIVLESDKASMEIPATAAGTVLELRVALGDALSEGDAVLVVDAAEGGMTTEAADSGSSESVPEPQASSPSSGQPAAEADPGPASDETPLAPAAVDAKTPRQPLRSIRLRAQLSLLVGTPMAMSMPVRRCANWPGNLALNWLG